MDALLMWQVIAVLFGSSTLGFALAFYFTRRALKVMEQQNGALQRAALNVGNAVENSLSRFQRILERSHQPMVGPPELKIPSMPQGRKS